MTSEYKFHSYVTVATVMVMYFMIENVAPFLNEFGVAKPIVTLLSAVGIYNLFAKILSSLARNWLWLKKHLLGASFLNGTWVGEFKGSNNEKIITWTSQTLLDTFNSYNVTSNRGVYEQRQTVYRRV
jgi:hypothetical protein